uniref:Uncharacterized protein n=1 Tax=Siphoviridae sp. ctSXZ3 TaxID=2825510 RepID=A0A8S5VES6_9CAUD|nr:MAG TPA: hypothetical protein [Siphoviridae sp. ctSXZ3]
MVHRPILALNENGSQVAWHSTFASHRKQRL